jgi:hypothetical protein
MQAVGNAEQLSQYLAANNINKKTTRNGQPLDPNNNGVSLDELRAMYSDKVELSSLTQAEFNQVAGADGRLFTSDDVVELSTEDAAAAKPAEEAGLDVKPKTVITADDLYAIILMSTEHTLESLPKEEFLEMVAAFKKGGINQDELEDLVDRGMSETWFCAFTGLEDGEKGLDIATLYDRFVTFNDFSYAHGLSWVRACDSNKVYFVPSSKNLLKVAQPVLDDPVKLKEFITTHPHIFAQSFGTFDFKDPDAVDEIVEKLQYDLEQEGENKGKQTKVILHRVHKQLYDKMIDMGYFPDLTDPLIEERYLQSVLVGDGTDGFLFDLGAVPTEADAKVYTSQTDTVKAIRAYNDPEINELLGKVDVANEKFDSNMAKITDIVNNKKMGQNEKAAKIIPLLQELTTGEEVATPKNSASGTENETAAPKQA